jgi:succinylglutamic semialdehyde dehydrogenase
LNNGLLIAGNWTKGDGEMLHSKNPAIGEIIWTGPTASSENIDAAVTAARKALPAWSTLTVEQRTVFLTEFANQLSSNRASLADLISRETGKPLWESLTEADSMKGKVAASVEAFQTRRNESTRKIGDADGIIRYKPHGVVAVLGPYNFPGHLPNGHIVPALLAGNTVIFKPSELTPAVAEKTAELWQQANLPPGVLNLVQGARATGEALVTHPDIDGVFFTGSLNAGRAINRALADHPGKIAALEMGGNNPLVVHNVSDLAAAANIIVQSAFVTAGQRCSCARRLIVSNETAEFLCREIAAVIDRMIIGPYTLNPEPYMGPLITDRAASEILAAQSALEARGAKPIIRSQRLDYSPAFITPGLIDITDISNRPDDEIFGPLLQMVRFGDFDEAIHECNRTCYGLAAGLLSDDRALFDRFLREVRAGVVNFNRPLTGASGLLPFGGVGCSGNHRPSGYFAADYCSYPVASLESDHLASSSKPVGFK